jgi:hypothetical protein
MHSNPIVQPHSTDDDHDERWWSSDAVPNKGKHKSSINDLRNPSIVSKSAVCTQSTQTGAYRSELVLRVFAAHLQTVLKTDVSYGHPVGAMAISCAAVSILF